MIDSVEIRLLKRKGANAFRVSWSSQGTHAPRDYCVVARATIPRRGLYSVRRVLFGVVQKKHTQADMELTPEQRDRIVNELFDAHNYYRRYFQ